MNQIKILMMPLTYAKHVCLRALSDSYKDRIENFVLKWQNKVKRNSVVWHN